MNYKHWEKLLLKEINRRWNKSKKFLPSHGPIHHIRVWKNAETFGLKKKADMEVLVASCLLHDIAAYNPSKASNHEIVSAKIASQLLKKIAFPIAKIGLVTDCISHHRSGYTKSISLEAKIMKSFDKIDALGPIGVYRIITPLGIRGWTAEKIVKKYLYQGGITKKWEAIAFPELKRKHKKDYLYSLNYFKKLAEELGV
ncbi:MAG: HD domain-containing protein [Patescibacteria group bacterium]